MLDVEKAKNKRGKPAKSLVRLGNSLDVLHGLKQPKSGKKAGLRLRGKARKDFAATLNTVVKKSIECIAESTLPVFVKGKHKGDFRVKTLGGSKKHTLAIKSDKCFPK